MKKLFKKGVMLFAAAMAFCAFAMPSMASAASWSPAGLETGLHSNDFGFLSTSSAFGRVLESCTRSSFTATVDNILSVTLSAISFGGHCTATFVDVPGVPVCTTTATATAFPWRVTATATDNIQVHNILIDKRFENTPGNVGCSNAGLVGIALLLTGTLRDGRWTGNAVGQRSIVYSNAEGLVFHSGSTGESNRAVTVRGTINPTGALQVFP